MRRNESLPSARRLETFARRLPAANSLFARAPGVVPQVDRRTLRRASRVVALLAGTALSTAAARAQDATWLTNPGSNDFNTPANWTPATVPTGTASFGTSTVTALSFSTDTTLGGWTFNTGASNYTFTNGHYLQFNGAGIVINGGSATITNNYVVQFNGNSTAGSATISNNTVNSDVIFQNTSTAGSANITNNVFNSGTFFDDSSTAGSATITNNTSGAIIGFNPGSNAGSATIVNNVGQLFFASASAGNATIINNSTNTQFSGSGTAGNAKITNNANEDIFFLNSSTAGAAAITNKGFIFFDDGSSAGSATITTGSGTSLDFSTFSTAGNATIINNGSLDFSFQDHTSAADANITINAGRLDFSGNATAGSATITTNSGGLILLAMQASGGAARFIFSGTGTMDMSGLTTGGTTAGSIEGDGRIFLGANNLTVGANGLSTVFSGVIQDGSVFGGGGTGGSLTKVGSGTLTLSGINTYTGATVINAGGLEVDGAIQGSSSVTVNSGGLLSGTGVINPATTIMSGGTLAPGNAANPTGTLAITGDLVFQSGAFYAVHVKSSAASSTVVGGTASLAGTVQVSFAPGGIVSKQKQYTILTATGGLGGTTFGGLANINFPAGASDSLSYDADHVYLNMTVPFTSYTGLNQNQQSVANALTNYFNTTGGIPAQFFGLTPAGLTQIDGEAATGAERAAYQLTDEFLGLMLDPFVNGRANGGGSVGGPALGFAGDEQTSLPPDAALAYAAILGKAPPASVEPRWTAWGSAFGGANRTNGDPVVVGSSDTTASSFGFAGGLDYHLSPHTVVGFALAGAGTNWGLANALGGGRSDALQAGAYGISWLGPAYVAGALSFSNHWFTTDRSPFGAPLNANLVGQGYGARFEAGYRGAAAPTLAVTPYGAVQLQDFNTPAYSESDPTGSGFGLSYNAMNATDVRTELGARLDAPTLLSGRPLVLYGRIAWAHDFVNNPALSAAFQALPGTSFTVSGAPIPHDSALATAGAHLFLTPRWTLLAKFDGEFGNGSQTYAGSGTLRYSW